MTSASTLFREQGTRRLILSLPADPKRTGRESRRRMLRALAVWGVLWIVGFWTVSAGAPEGLTAVAVGIAVPAGGLMVSAHWALALGGVAVFVVAVFIWWAAGPVILPPLVWLGLAVLPLAVGTAEMSVVGAVVALALPLVAIAVGSVVQEVRFRRQVQRGRHINHGLAQQIFTVTGPPTTPEVRESSEEDLASLRYALDLALQPIDRFDGFTKIDQFREAALRYQLNSLGYALSTAQYTRTPAFTGYLAEAQRNTIHKMLDKRVWGYWAIENLWGNLRWNPDPIERENIMLTGFFGLQIGMYETLNDDRFSADGALTFRWNEDRVYPNNFTSLAQSIHRNMLGSDYTLFPCEPNWTYTVCNTFGLNTLITHDRLHGTTFATDVLDRLHHAYETEFLRPDGRIVGVRCERLGLSWNLWAGPAIQLTTAFWLHAGLPDLAQRTWWIVRDQEMRQEGDRVTFPPRVTSRLDPGNYRLGNDAYGQAMIAMAAREMGDEKTAFAATAGLEESGDAVTRDGVRRYAALSGLGNLYALQSRFNRASGLRDLVTYGVPDEWRKGPVLAEAAYPDVLVARAVSDGTGLDLVLRPGNGPRRTTLRIDRLVPQREYVVTGARSHSLTASVDGQAVIEIDLGGRHEVRIAPR
ncbi:hypothetical protein [Antrihabitans sp. YC2-6]|uniref:linalool dehydratase/isomerase domain-containing protein n=1 Tax=Antrihabitans sp. YC2-6 TaxID=2799498 RepID=UPI0018F6B962|nr:hypothetical protein [Antrihabitans sp. YC2-6]MBJ8347592.1 hypothetical protein [Antrihabitans sp. YC2-6]